MSSLQESANILSGWSNRNDMKTDNKKTKEMVMCLCKNPDHVSTVPKIITDGNQHKILGVTVPSGLKLNAHVDNFISKASKKGVSFIYRLKSAGVVTRVNFLSVLGVVCPVLETFVFHIVF